MIKNKVVKNASWIIGCKIIQSVFALIVSMLTARYLGPSNFGLINYAASIVAFFLPIAQLGINNVLVQEFVNTPEEEGKILGTSLVSTFISALASIVGVISFASVANHDEPVTIIVCALYSVMIVFQTLELTQYWFQAKYLSKYTSIISLIAYLVISAYKIFLLITGKSIYWFAISNALDYMIIAVAMLVTYKKLGGKKLSVSFPTFKYLFSKSKHYIVTGLMITVFAQTDKIMLKLIVGDEETGFYSAAFYCASLTAFVFTAIIDSVRPFVFESLKKSVQKFEDSMKMLFGIIIGLSLLQSVFMTLFSSFIIYVMYGSDYMAAAPILALVVWYTPFSYVGSVRNIWVLAENKQKYLWILKLSGALMNVVLNFIFIPIWGGAGAALASMITQFFTNVVMVVIIKPMRRSAYLMLKSLNFVSLAKSLKNRND